MAAGVGALGLGLKGLHVYGDFPDSGFFSGCFHKGLRFRLQRFRQHVGHMQSVPTKCTSCS